MSTGKKAILLFLFLGLMSPLEGGARHLKVKTSIFPLMDFARQVAGDRAEVSLLLPPGVDVHTWQPRPGDMLALSKADLFLFCGGSLEPWAEGLIKNYRNSGGQVLEAGAGLATLKNGFDPYREHSSGATDPHVWLDFGRSETIVRRIEGKLAELDPEGKVLFHRRAQTLIEKLRALDNEFQKKLQNCRQRTVVLAGHAAFGYLASRYRLVQVSVSGLSPDAEPGPRRVVRIVDMMRREGLTSIFYIKNESRKLAEVLARETGAGLLPLNPAHNLTRDELRSGLTFLDIMKENLDSLSRGLSCAEK